MSRFSSQIVEKLIYPIAKGAPPPLTPIYAAKLRGLRKRISHVPMVRFSNFLNFLE